MTTAPIHPTPPPAATHSLEPWFSLGPIIHNYDGQHIGLVNWSENSDGTFGTDSERANAERIVQCVNALAGIADPAAELARLRVENEKLKRNRLDCIEAK